MQIKKGPWSPDETKQFQELVKNHLNNMTQPGMMLAGGAGIANLGLPTRLLGPSVLGSSATGLANMGIRGAANTILGGAVNTTNPGDQSAMDKFKSGAMSAAPWAAGGEIVGALPRIIGGLAEAIHPEKWAGNVATRIRDFARQGQQDMQREYAIPTNQYGDQQIVGNQRPRNFLGFHPSETQYFTPDARRAVRTFEAEPTFQNAHRLQSVLGNESARFGGNVNKIENYQAMRNAREQVNDRIQNFLSRDPVALGHYNAGRAIARDRYFPYVQNDTLRNITNMHGPIERFDPHELNNALRTSPLVQQSARNAEPINHPLVGLAHEMGSKMNRAELARYGIPMAGTIGAGALSGPLAAAGAGLVGAGLGWGASNKAAQLAQNPSLVEAFRRASRGLYPGLQGLMQYTK